MIIFSSSCSVRSVLGPPDRLIADLFALERSRAVGGGALSGGERIAVLFVASSATVLNRHGGQSHGKGRGCSQA